MKNRKNRKAFTLIELLVVIAIIAILSVVVILTLNPAELLRQSRDSNRISDMATLKSAISLYLADVSSPTIGTSGACYLSLPVAAPTSTTGPFFPTAAGTWTATMATSTCGSWFASALTGSAGIATVTAANARNVNGTGWIPVAFTNISSGAPIGNLPLDPVNVTGTPGTSKSTGAFVYTYIASGTTFKFGAFMESSKYSTGGSADVETGDGGNNNYVYEQGTSLGL
jgi:prepilin-type N-terminal cleavage/methylation domain-containing protein